MPIFPGSDVDATIGMQLAQAAAAIHASMLQTLESARAGDRLVAELVRTAAQQNADLFAKSAGANQILTQVASANTLLAGLLAQITEQLRASGGQPQASADKAGVNQGGPPTD